MSGSFSRNRLTGAGGRRAPIIGGPIILGDGGGGPPITGRAAPGSITDDQLSGARVSTEHIRFARQGFAYDGTKYAVGAHDNTGWSRTGGVANSLLLRLGSAPDPFVAYVWASVSWANNAASAFAGRSCIVLYQGTDTDADGVIDTWVDYQRSINSVVNAIPADGRARLFSPFCQFVVPPVEGVDWWVGMQHQVTSGSGPLSGSQDQSDQTLMAYTCAFDPLLDSALVTDTGLE